MSRKLTPLAAGLLATTFMAAPAYAQNADASAQADDTIDDNVIIVTATRRAEDVQDIPIAVTAVSPAQLEKQGVVNVQEITQVSPSFSTSQAQNSSGTVVLRIRGVGTTSNNIGFESAVGVFIDGAYQSRAGIALSEFVDVERVEVLRGPQGTLFGRNTSAGALNITNKRPELGEFGGFVNATYGNFDHMNLQGAVNIPLTEDTVALRLTGAWRERDGFVDWVDAGGTKFGEGNDADQYLLRGQIGWETDSGLRGRLIGDYSKSEGVCCSAVELLQSSVETSGAFALVGLGPRGGMSGPDVALDPFDTRTAEKAAKNQIASINTPHLNSTDQWGVTAEVEFPVGDAVDLIYIGSFRNYESAESYDSDFSAIDIFDVAPGGGTEIETMTHELRLQGDAGRLQWMIGGYYSDEEIFQEVNFRLGEDYDGLVGALFGGAFGPAPLALLSGGVDASVVTATNAYSQDSKSWSIFTHNTFEITDDLSLTLGARWSDESKDGSFTQPAVNNPLCPAILGSIGAGNVPGSLVNTVFVLGCFPFVAPAVGSDANPFPLPRTFDGKFKDDELIYTAKLGYDFGDLNTYASFTHGYKAGGFNLDSTAAAGGADPRFASEEVDAWEIGMKGRFMDGAITANLALFHQEFSNFQVLEFTGAQFQTFNVPKATSKGFELETQIRPTDGLTINAGLTYVDAEYPGDCADTSDALRVQNLCGSPLTNAPEIVSILGATYEGEISDRLAFFLNGQIRTESDRRTSTQPRTPPTTQAALGTTPLLPFDYQDGNVKVNLRAGIGSIDESWTLEGWVTNLTNEVTRGVTFNTVLRGSSRSAFTQQPRMYGLTVRTKF
ncbi:TonB-dependent receptor [Altererythrobacter sp.]|uniref:TonB-dependent receptor n=1 Tax=Altererythrobacter sp. TaxID=1872480 RepID=UPI001B0A5FA9|nr:TonB-dependent receptor [Altererythrobacter sp.]MBO6608553.1 TonB-dependent receptor [Altererythrobacter sp.]MBO6642806.1 TonB-dependent receptor [Altererythrobacter sp.]MBO6709549.1 TonB-dependent receptor [Altererythrobacter sp.]MBO6944144.1 TonB-dependent receptor [Altererythrobacter sp.]